MTTTNISFDIKCAALGVGAGASSIAKMAKYLAEYVEKNTYPENTIEAETLAHYAGVIASDALIVLKAAQYAQGLSAAADRLSPA